MKIRSFDDQKLFFPILKCSELFIFQVKREIPEPKDEGNCLYIN